MFAAKQFGIDSPIRSNHAEIRMIESAAYAQPHEVAISHRSISFLKTEDGHRVVDFR